MMFWQNIKDKPKDVDDCLFFAKNTVYRGSIHKNVCLFMDYQKTGCVFLSEKPNIKIEKYCIIEKPE